MTLYTGYMYTLYVGSPNTTHRLDDTTLSEIKRITSSHFESYTYVKARGVYKDTEEDVVMISIAQAEKSAIYALGEALRAYLRQDSVAVEHNGVYEKLITK